MKKLIVFVMIITGLIGSIIYFGQNTVSDENYLRIHIRANSNISEDQEVKLLVRDKILDILTPLLAEAKTKEEAMEIIDKNLDFLSQEASKKLYEEGFSYGAEAILKKEEFPSRSYDGIVLESGIYDALIINLGSASGDNWWCVAFPPLCFVPAKGKNIKYKSKIMEIIENAKCEKENK